MLRFKGNLYFKQPLSYKEVKLFDTFKEDFISGDTLKYTKEDIIDFEFDLSYDNTYMYWDNSENTSDFYNKIKLFIKFMVENSPTFELNGELIGQGEDIDDRFKIIVDKNVVTESYIEDNFIELKLYQNKEEIWLNGNLFKQSERLSFFDLEGFENITKIKVNSYD